MVSITQDPLNTERSSLTVTVTLYLDKLLTEATSQAVAEMIAKQAAHDLKRNPTVKAEIAKAATKKLLTLLGVTGEEKQ
jgi:acyl-CoA hydrolase